MPFLSGKNPVVIPFYQVSYYTKCITWIGLESTALSNTQPVTRVRLNTPFLSQRVHAHISRNLGYHVLHEQVEDSSATAHTPGRGSRLKFHPFYSTQGVPGLILHQQILATTHHHSRAKFWGNYQESKRKSDINTIKTHLP